MLPEVTCAVHEVVEQLPSGNDHTRYPYSAASRGYICFILVRDRYTLTRFERMAAAWRPRSRHAPLWQEWRGHLLWKVATLPAPTPSRQAQILACYSADYVPTLDLRPWSCRLGWQSHIRVACLRAVDNVPRLLPSRRSEIKQPVIRPRNPFSRLHPARLACICAHRPFNVKLAPPRLVLIGSHLGAPAHRCVDNDPSCSMLYARTVPPLRLGTGIALA